MGRTGASIIGLAVVWMASAPCSAWGQSAWPSYPNNNAISVTSAGNVGIGTTNPTYRFEVYSTADAPTARFTGTSLMYGPQFVLDATQAGGSEFRLVSTPQNGPAGANKFALWGAAHGYLMAVTSAGNVGIGTTNPQYLLSVKGTAGAEEFIVTNTGWSDYVFQPGYRLRPLSEVGSDIEANHLLPDIPSEAEVKEKGVGIGEMQSKLLAKVEELTLHMIQQEKENQELRERIARLEKGAAGDATPTAAK